MFSYWTLSQRLRSAKELEYSHKSMDRPPAWYVGLSYGQPVRDQALSFGYGWVALQKNLAPRAVLWRTVGGMDRDVVLDLQLTEEIRRSEAYHMECRWFIRPRGWRQRSRSYDPAPGECG